VISKGEKKRHRKSQIWSSSTLKGNQEENECIGDGEGLMREASPFQLRREKHGEWLAGRRPAAMVLFPL
jgi:hypothetical protein